MKNINIFLLAQLLVKCSIHNNTNGQFSAYYKDDYGGKNNVDIKRITKIELEMPIFFDNKCNVFISKEILNDWIKNIPKLDIVYYSFFIKYIHKIICIFITT